MLFSSEVPADTTNEAQCSLYMKELQQFVIRANNFYLTPFECQSFIMDRFLLTYLRDPHVPTCTQDIYFIQTCQMKCEIKV